jgi:hypothetical protein
MSKLKSTHSNTFKFIDEFSSLKSSYYLSTITVKELEYDDGNYYFDIDYVNKFVSTTIDTSDSLTEKLKEKIHPFYGSHIKDFMKYEGDIVKKNPLTSIMIEYLLMDYEQLALVSGFTTPQRYKQNIMWSLNYFWD